MTRGRASDCEALIDALINMLIDEADFLKTPSERLRELESKRAVVKAELGLLRLAAFRVRR